ncbi:DUF1446 domain-containing protein [Sandaracinomonas limnophila]|uniref:DUF1446 domain-containing protein n=1 Tax=Sandaracinomonas limnophila TaxID=1862386 RepID=A0A437PNZ7_9BACT|nr:acyclic terpene utilization AtuA family protein [Sandaracinomonas limnophila]RVU24011.1 DUF1446 domain-containing protein [Sandaracinomonas limnophila]
MKTIRIGSGAGFSGDRIEPAVLLAEKADLNYLVLECLAERTIALAQKRKLANPDLGYDPLLEKRIRPLLPHIKKNKVRLISNIGAANPLAAAKKIKEISIELGLEFKIAAVLGDDVLEFVELNKSSLQTLETGKSLAKYDILSANAYIGAEGIVEALHQGADIIITGRVADPSLFLAPMLFEFNWESTDWEKLGRGTIVGHLLECAGQLTGGYFADLRHKKIEDLANLGFPFADVSEDGLATFSKLPKTGGLLNLKTAKEQLLYEVVNPHAYLTPDVSADFMSVQLKEIEPNQVQLFAGGGNEKPKTLKVSVGYRAFFQGEGEISYGGSDAVERAKLAGEIILQRFKSEQSEQSEQGFFQINANNKSEGLELQIALSETGGKKDQIWDLRIELIGVDSLFQGSLQNSKPTEVRLRVVGKATTAELANLIGEEVDALYTNGPAGGGGVRKNTIEQIGIVSVLFPRELIEQTVIFV